MTKTPFDIGEELANDFLAKYEKFHCTRELIRSKALQEMAQYMENGTYDYEVLRGFVSTVNALT